MSDHHEVFLYHGTSRDPDEIRATGLVPDFSVSHPCVFLTDNPELAIDYAVTDQDRTGFDRVVVVRVRAADLDPKLMMEDLDHTTVRGWSESLRDCDQCMFMGTIPPDLLTFGIVDDENDLNFEVEPAHSM